MIDSLSSSSGNNINDPCSSIGFRKRKSSPPKIHCIPRKIYPLRDEELEDLAYPTLSYHYSVSSDARYVYVIGEQPFEPWPQLFVWDLHRGISRRYGVSNLPSTSLMKHLYEINPMYGILICRNGGYFHIYSVWFDHSQQLIHIRKTLFCQRTPSGYFWSSARAIPADEIIFMYQLDHCFCVAQLSVHKPVRSVSLASRMSSIKFSGQPWVYGVHMYLFESNSIFDSAEKKYLTGRLVRANLNTGEVDFVYTKATGTIRDSLPHIVQEGEQQQQLFNISRQLLEARPLIKRVKHVERDGWLWIIAEFAKNLHGTNSQTDNARCEVCVLEMRTLTWYQLDWPPQCSFEELTLDVANCGTVVLLRKGIVPMSNRAIIDSFLLFSRNPGTLLIKSFRALITYFPALRNLNCEQMHELGIPAKLLSP